MLQEFTQEVKNTTTELMRDIHTAIPGKIAKYDAAKCEAEIIPYGKFKKPNGDFMDYPQLNSIPILFPQSCGQDFSIVYPVNPGDECLVLVQEQTLDTWRGSGSESNNDLRFDLTNAIAIVGLFSKPQPLAKEAQDDNKLIVQKDGHRLHIAPGDMLLQFNAAVNILLNDAGITITAPLINLVATNITGAAAANITLTAPAVNLNP